MNKLFMRYLYKGLYYATKAALPVALLICFAGMLGYSSKSSAALLIPLLALDLATTLFNVPWKTKTSINLATL